MIKTMKLKYKIHLHLKINSPGASPRPPSEAPAPPSLSLLPTLLSSSAAFGLQLFRFHQSGDPLGRGCTTLGWGLRGGSEKASAESPTEAGFYSPTIMVPIMLARQEGLRDEYSHCGAQNKERERNIYRCE